MRAISTPTSSLAFLSCSSTSRRRRRAGGWPPRLRQLVQCRGPARPRRRPAIRRNPRDQGAFVLRHERNRRHRLRFRRRDRGRRRVSAAPSETSRSRFVPATRHPRAAAGSTSPGTAVAPRYAGETDGRRHVRGRRVPDGRPRAVRRPRPARPGGAGIALHQRRGAEGSAGRGGAGLAGDAGGSGRPGPWRAGRSPRRADCRLHRAARRASGRARAPAVLRGAPGSVQDAAGRRLAGRPAPERRVGKSTGRSWRPWCAERLRGHRGRRVCYSSGRSLLRRSLTNGRRGSAARRSFG